MVSCAILLARLALTLEFMIALTIAVPTEPPRALVERTMAVLVAMRDEGALSSETKRQDRTRNRPIDTRQLTANCATTVRKVRGWANPNPASVLIATARPLVLTLV